MKASRRDWLIPLHIQYNYLGHRVNENFTIRGLFHSPMPPTTYYIRSLIPRKAYIDNLNITFGTPYQGANSEYTRIYDIRNTLLNDENDIDNLLSSYEEQYMKKFEKYPKANFEQQEPITEITLTGVSRFHGNTAQINLHVYVNYRVPPEVIQKFLKEHNIHIWDDEHGIANYVKEDEVQIGIREEELPPGEHISIDWETELLDQYRQQMRTRGKKRSDKRRKW
ncbi:MAG: hypothetical protein OWS74_05345 [Firmicutes bacterium]|nr:hypothetical protein [Bacillota bacterium]